MTVSDFFADPYWEAFGLLGQICFAFRFIYQWIVSGKARRSVVPVGFWWLSIMGSIMIFVYAVHKTSPTFMIPTLLGLPIYIRNLVLISREHKLGAG